MMFLKQRKQKAQQMIEYIIVVTAVVLVVYAFVNRTAFKQIINENLKAPSKMMQIKQNQLPK